MNAQFAVFNLDVAVARNLLSLAPPRLRGALEATSAVFGRAGVAGPGEPSLVEFVVRGALEVRGRPQLARAPALRRAGESWSALLLDAAESVLARTKSYRA